MTMDENAALMAFAALSQETRLRMFNVCHEAREWRQAPSAQQWTARPPRACPFISYLEQAGLVNAACRTLHHLHLSGLSSLVEFPSRLLQAPEVCNPYMAALSSVANQKAQPILMQASDRIFNILFLCTGNSARSILARSEQGWRGRFRAFSGVSQGAVALKVLKATTPLMTCAQRAGRIRCARCAGHGFRVRLSAAGEACLAEPADDRALGH